MNPPRISIGIPVYNGERFLSETIDSLLRQTVGEFELFIVDNASTDRTEEIGREFAARDKRVRFVRNETNIGAYRNCNKVIQMGSGEYFKLNMADDVCHPELLARALEVMDAHRDVVLTYARARYIDEQGHPLEMADPGWPLVQASAVERMRHVIASGHKINLFYGLMRSRILAQTRLFPAYAGGDFRLVGELALKGKFFEIPEQLFYRRIHPQASSQNAGLEWESEFFKGRAGQVELPYWHLCLDHARSVLRSDLSPGEKARCLQMIVKVMFWGRHRLLTEIQQAFQFLYGSH